MTDDRRVGDQRDEQEAADRALRELFAGRPCPDLPPFFASRCAARAALQPSARPLGARERLIMRIYWANALAMGGVVLARTGSPVEVSPVVAAAAMLSIAIALLPVFLFASMRGGLCALMRRVMGSEPPASVSSPRPPC